jgi:chemotaxis protein MotB
MMSSHVNNGEEMEEETAGGPLWLVTFADLTAILVALFVLIFSMSSPMADKGMGAGAGANVDTNLTVASDAGDRFAGATSPRADLTIGYLSAVLSDRGILQTGKTSGDEQGVVRYATHHIDGDRLVMRLNTEVVFQSGGARVSPMATDLIATLSDVLSNVANPVSVISPVLSDDWAQAFDRADALVGSLRETGYRASVEKFVSPGVPGGALLIVVGRNGGGYS